MFCFNFYYHFKGVRNRLHITKGKVSVPLKKTPVCATEWKNPECRRLELFPFHIKGIFVCKYYDCCDHIPALISSTVLTWRCQQYETSHPLKFIWAIIWKNVLDIHSRPAALATLSHSSCRSLGETQMPSWLIGGEKWYTRLFSLTFAHDK